MPWKSKCCGACWVRYMQCYWTTPKATSVELIQDTRVARSCSKAEAAVPPMVEQASAVLEASVGPARVDLIPARSRSAVSAALNVLSVTSFLGTSKSPHAAPTKCSAAPGSMVHT
jgi:hypothetical protein